MNYLAHSYLSFQKEDITIGNFIADSIIGNQYTHLPEGIIKGINLHRKIDTFTDSHPLFIQTKRRFSSKFDKFSSILTDIIYDHYLAANFSKYGDSELDTFSQYIYQLLRQNLHYIPKNGIGFYDYMVKRNVYVEYASINGLQIVLEHFSHRIKHRHDLTQAIPILNDHYDDISLEFHDFFEELRQYCLNQPELSEI